MSSLPKLFFSVLAFLLIFAVTSHGQPDTTVEQVLCNGESYSAGDPFGDSLDYVVSDLQKVTPGNMVNGGGGYDYYDISPYPNSFAYGHATCNRNLTSSDCGACLGAAKEEMFGTCPGRIGARALLRDCSIRYEQYPFTE